jgi:DNA end-binding protein Ku
MSMPGALIIKEGAIMARAIWKGNISFGLVNIPISLYPAENRSDLHFKLLDRRNGARIRYQRVNEATGEEVPWDEIAKAYEYDDEGYVLLEEEDFKKADVEASQTIEIEDFVDADAVDYVYFDKPYYLVPGKRGEKGYVLMRETLKRLRKVGIARVVIRTKQYLAALIPEGNALVLDLLRYRHEVRDPADFEFPSEDLQAYRISEKELDMAHQLVEAMSTEWNPEKYKDEYRESLMHWIEKKAREGDMATPPEGVPSEERERGAEVIDLMTLLKKSVQEKAGAGGKPKRGKTRSSGKRGSSQERASGDR